VSGFFLTHSGCCLSLRLLSVLVFSPSFLTGVVVLIKRKCNHCDAHDGDDSSYIHSCLICDWSKVTKKQEISSIFSGNVFLVILGFVKTPGFAGID
jgi:hypothetical protein